MVQGFFSINSFWFIYVGPKQEEWGSALIAVSFDCICVFVFTLTFSCFICVYFSNLYFRILHLFNLLNFGLFKSKCIYVGHKQEERGKGNPLIAVSFDCCIAAKVSSFPRTFH